LLVAIALENVEKVKRRNLTDDLITKTGNGDINAGNRMATKANLKKALNGNLTVNVETASKIN
jgi:hypothetical protein